MSNKAPLISKSLAIVLLLVILMCAIGIAYAFWSAALNISAGVKTGGFSLTFNPDRPVSAGILDIYGENLIYETADISMSIDADGSSASLSVPLPFLTDELALTGRALVFMYPLDFAETSTVTEIKCFEQDFDSPSEEKIELCPNSVTVSINGFDYDILSLNPEFVEEPLYFDVYRRVGTESGQIVGTVFLVMTPETAAYLTEEARVVHLNESDLPPELLFLRSGQYGYADITVNYSFALPLYVEQGV